MKSKNTTIRPSNTLCGTQSNKKNFSISLLVAVIFVFLSACPQKSCAAVKLRSVYFDFGNIEKLNDLIIQKECELFRINTYFRLENGIQPAGRRWRMMYYQTTNYACTFAGLLVNMIYNFYYYAHGNGHASVPAQLGATIPRFVGKSVYLGGLMIEIPIQAMEHYKEKRTGFDAHSIYRRVLVVNQEIEELLKKRTDLVSATRQSIPAKTLALIEQDGKILADGRQLAVEEFSMLYARSVSLSIRTRLYNTLTFIKKADAAFGADLVRIIAGARQDRFLNAPASMSTSTSGYMSAFDPWVEMSSEKVTFGNRYKDMLAKMDSNGAVTLKKFDADCHMYSTIKNSVNPDQEPILSSVIEKHSDIYQGMGGLVDSFEYLRRRELKEEKKHDVHSLVYHAIYGGSKASRGTWLIYVGFRYLYGPGHSKHAALLNGFAGIDNFSGSAYRLADFLICDTLAILNRHKDRIKYRAKVAMVKSRLEALDSMEEDAISCSENFRTNSQPE